MLQTWLNHLHAAQAKDEARIGRLTIPQELEAAKKPQQRHRTDLERVQKEMMAR